MENKEINSHFIQKAMAKRWAINDRVSYIKHGTKEGGSFNIKNPAKNQPIAIEGFYAREIEKGMNTLEAESGQVIKKILLANKEVTLTRKEVTTIKFYILLSSTRTELVRKGMQALIDIKFTQEKTTNINNDVTSKRNQEIVIKTLFQKYNDYKQDDLVYFNKRKEKFIKMMLNSNFNKEKGYKEFFSKNTIELKVDYTINSAMLSELIFVNFKENELLLTEVAAFLKLLVFTPPSLKYVFFPISPKIGILLVSPFHHTQLSNQLKKENDLFSFDLDEFPKIKYLKETEIAKAYNDFYWNTLYNNSLLKNKNNDNEIEKFNLFEKPKFYTNKDKFTYQIHFESEKVGIICNSMALSNCNNSYVIYKSIHDYSNALQWLKKNYK